MSSRIKKHQYICLELFWSFFLLLDHCIFLSSFRRDDIFHWRKNRQLFLYFSQRQQFYIKNTLICICFLQMHIFSLYQDVNCWMGVVWITYFYKMFGLSFWWHQFNATFLQISSHEEIKPSTSWMACEWILSKFSFSFILFFFYSILLNGSCIAMLP